MPAPDSPKRGLSFTIKAPGHLRVLETDVIIGAAFQPSDKQPPNHGSTMNVKGIWDTGATGTVISQEVVAQLGLKPIGMTKVSGVNGQHNSEVFLVSLGLPNRVMFPEVRVVKGQMGSANVLIGMDIITRGDFALTHHLGKTCFSFRIPSIECIDFVAKSPAHQAAANTSPVSASVGRNDPCPCGSGRKYKKCCLK